MEKILSINELNDSKKDGYIIKTDKQEIIVAIENRQFCCENWGYLSSEDDLTDFLHSDFLEINTTDTSLNTKVFDKLKNIDITEDSAVFVTFKTSKGDFQIIVYNEHNGFYGHSVTIQSNQINRNFII